MQKSGRAQKFNAYVEFFCLLGISYIDTWHEIIKNFVPIEKLPNYDIEKYGKYPFNELWNEESFVW